MVINSRENGQELCNQACLFISSTIFLNSKENSASQLKFSIKFGVVLSFAQLGLKTD